MVVDYILVIVADVDLDVNPNEVRDTRYVSPEELKEMFQQPGKPRFVYLIKSRLTIHAMVPVDLQEVPFRLVATSRQSRSIRQRTRNHSPNDMTFHHLKTREERDKLYASDNMTQSIAAKPIYPNVSKPQ